MLGNVKNHREITCRHRLNVVFDGAKLREGLLTKHNHDENYGGDHADKGTDGDVDPFVAQLFLILNASVLQEEEGVIGRATLVQLFVILFDEASDLLYGQRADLVSLAFVCWCVGAFSLESLTHLHIIDKFGTLVVTVFVVQVA